MKGREHPFIKTSLSFLSLGCWLMKGVTSLIKGSSELCLMKGDMRPGQQSNERRRASFH